MMLYERLVRVEGWTLPASEAIHRVQIDSDPNRYTKWESLAVAVTSVLTVPCTGRGSG